VRAAGGADPAVVCAEGLCEPVGDVDEVLDALPGSILTVTLSIHRFDFTASSGGM